MTDILQLELLTMNRAQSIQDQGHRFLTQIEWMHFSLELFSPTNCRSIVTFAGNIGTIPIIISVIFAIVVGVGFGVVVVEIWRTICGFRTFTIWTISSTENIEEEDNFKDSRNLLYGYSFSLYLLLLLLLLLEWLLLLLLFLLLELFFCTGWRTWSSSINKILVILSITAMQIFLNDNLCLNEITY